MKRGAVVLAAVLTAYSAKALDVSAVLDWPQRLTLSTPVSGIVASVPVKPGQAVNQGQILLEMDSRRLAAQLERIQAQRKRLQLTVQEARREFERAQELYDRTVISTRDLQLAEIELAISEAALAETDAELASVRIDLEQSVLRAPFAGIVIDTHVAPGQTVSNELQVTPLVTIAATDKMLAKARVDGTMVDRLKVGETVNVVLGERRVTGTLTRLGLEPFDVSSKPVGYEIEVTIVPPEGQGLRVGQEIRIELPDSRR